MKVCNKCNLEKDYKSFYKDKTKKDGYMNSCKECKKKYEDLNKEKIILNKKKYYIDNKSEKLEYNKKYYSNKKDEILEHSKEYYLINRGNKLEYQKKYYKENKEKIQNYKSNNRNKINERFNTKYKNDPVFKLKKIISSVVYRSINKGGYNKNSKTSIILGCSFEDFKCYIESQFKENMSWENHGLWHLDHKIPISWADSQDKVYELNHYTNFQPLWALDNQIKNNKYADE